MKLSLSKPLSDNIQIKLINAQFLDENRYLGVSERAYDAIYYELTNKLRININESIHIPLNLQIVMNSIL